ncbi:MAG TPA: CapA family protein [Acidimicrobiales bacterium]|nr:CapA family protein [Acidimicrobiales bacterium]
MAATRTRTALVIMVLVALGLVTACSSDGDPNGSGSGSTTGASTTVTESSSTLAPATTLPKPTARITINFAGDINFEDERAQLLESDPGAILGAIAPVLADADLTVVNLESALTERGSPAPKAFTFRTSPAALDVLRSAGVDVASLANNHGLDFGPDGVPDALAASRDKDFPIIGIGEDESQALAPYRTTIRGHRVSVIAATQVLDDNLISEWTATPDHPGLASAKRVDELVAQVRNVRPTTDTLVVFLHWGIERQMCPSQVQQELALELVGAGADIVVGGHAHRLQGAGRMGDAIVGYGLGNFAFYAGSPEAAATGVLQIQVGGGEQAQYQWKPARIQANGSPVPLTGQAADDAVAAWDALRGCTGFPS